MSYLEKIILKEFKNLYDKKVSTKSYKRLYQEIKIKDFSNIERGYDKEQEKEKFY